MFTLTESKYLIPGTLALKLNGKVVWYGSLSAPWEDVICDEAVIHTSDYDRLLNLTTSLPE